LSVRGCVCPNWTEALQELKTKAAMSKIVGITNLVRIVTSM